MRKKTDQKAKVFATVWRHWKPAFKKSGWIVVGGFIAYNIQSYLNLMLRPALFKDLFDAMAQKVSDWHTYNLIVIVTLVAWMMARAGDHLLAFSEARIMRSLKDYLMKGLLGKSTGFFETSRLGGLVAKAKRFSNESERVIDSMVFTIVQTILFVVYLIIYTAVTIPRVTPYIFVWVAAFTVVTIVFTKLRTARDVQAAEEDSHTLGFLSDILTSLQTLRVFSASPRVYEKFQNQTAKEYKTRLWAWLFGNIQWALQSLLSAVLEIVLFALMLTWYQEGTITIGTAVVIQTYSGLLIMKMWDLGKAITTTRIAFADSYEMASILDAVHDEPVDEVSCDTKPADNSVVLENISFGYSKKHTVVNNVSFQFESGKHYGLIGETGAGKSTITKLILRLRDHQEGRIFVRGIDSRMLNKHELRSWISYVPQLPTFPSWTIREIIKLGKPDATDEEVLIAARKASCHFIETKFHDGLDTHIGERGVRLSGGESQRLSIAAAILKNAPIVIMDEPTSALDAETEHAIQYAIRHSFKNKTLIVIAHRLATVAVLDEIILMKNGSIAECKPHHALLQSSSHYRSMWDLQTKPHTQMQ